MSDRDAVTRAVVPEPSLARRLWRAAQSLVGVALATAPVVGVWVVTHRSAIPVPPFFFPIPHVLAVGGVACGVAAIWLRRRAPRWSTEVSATASESGITLAGETVTRSEIVEATVTPRGTGLGAAIAGLFLRGPRPTAPGEDVYEVELKRAGRWSYPIRFVTRTLDDGRALLSALGLDASRRAVTRRLMSRALRPAVAIATVVAFFASFIAGAALAAATGSPAPWALPILGAIGLVTMQALAFVKTRMTIGADGVSMSWLGRTSTVPLTDITSVEIVPRGRMSPARVVVHRHAGEPLEVLVGTRGSSPLEPYVVEDECNLIVERIREAMTRSAALPPAEFRAWADRRHGTSVQAWMSMLRGASETYRQSIALPFTAEELWSVVTNVRATELERISAAAALTADSDERVSARMADVAQSTALPRVRTALEAAAKRDDAALTGVFESLWPEALIPTVRARVEVDISDATDEERSEEAMSKRSQR